MDVVRRPCSAPSSSTADEARAHLAAIGYDPIYGARPLKRAIQRHLLDPLALKILDGSVPENSRIEAVVEEGGLAFVPLGEHTQQVA